MPRLGVAGRKQFTGKLEMLVEEERSSLVPKSSSVEPPSSALSSLQGGSAQLKNLLESMPLEEKYSLLLQNYASSIMEQSAKDSDSVIKTMRSLYSEMLSLSVTPTEKSSRAMLNAAAVLCSSDTLGQVLQLVKASGALRAFGVANGQLTKPTVSALGSLLNKVEIPYDDREIEVFYASLVAGTTTLYFSLQLAGHTFFQDAQPWATLCGLLALIVSGADIGIRGGKGLKYAAAGIDRLVLRDAERENHCESAAFLTGYLLGLPCYCFQPDVNEALKLLRDAPGGLDVYKQRLARIKGSQGSKGGVSTISISSSKSTRRNLFGLPSALTSSTSKSSGVDRGSGAMESLLQSNSLAAGLKAEQADAELEKQRDILGKALLDFESKQESDIFGLGRVLVWMMAPVAAEEMKYVIVRGLMCLCLEDYYSMLLVLLLGIPSLLPSCSIIINNTSTAQHHHTNNTNNNP